MEYPHGGTLVARALKREGVEQVFGLIGYQVAPIFVGCYSENIKLFDVRHEQAAVNMADGYAQTTGKPGVVVVTGGPGFANAHMGILKAYYSHTPMIVITGAFDPSKRDTGGLQDLDQLSCVERHVKWAGTVSDVKRIPEYIAIAFRNAVNGRRGPVVLEIPINVLMQKTSDDEINWPIKYETKSRIRADERRIKEAVSLIKQSKKPIIVAGNGVFYSSGSAVLQDFVEHTGIPTFTVNAGRGSLPDDHELCFGQGRPLDAGSQLYAYQNADLLIVFGSSLDYSFFFAKGPIFNPELKIIQVDIDPCEIGTNNRTIDVGIVGDSSYAIKDILDEMQAQKVRIKHILKPWVDELRQEQVIHMNKLYAGTTQAKEDINPLDILNALNALVPRDAYVVVDGSNAMFWGSQFLRSYLPGHQIIGPSGTYGPMGTGLGLAMGVKVACPDKVVVLYTGDGSLGFSLTEISTAVRLGLNILIIVHNDLAWGFPRETQRLLFNETYGTELGMVQYEQVAQAFGAEGVLIEKSNEIRPAIDQGLASQKPYVINAIVDPDAVSPGANFLNNAHKTYKEFA